MVAVFVVSRVAIARAGVSFDDRPLNDAFQLLELAQLRDNLLTSLLHLHSQPPLFNLFVGLAVQLPSSLTRPVLHLSYLGMGLTLALGLYAALGRLRVRPPWAAGIVVVFVLSPSVFLFENWSHYDYPVAVLLCLAALALLRYEDGHRLGDAAAFIGLLAVLVLTRSMFHLVWFLVWVAVLVAHRRRADWRRLAAVASIPVVAVVGLHVQRLVAFGSPSSSTSLGMSVAKVTTFQLSEGERRALVAEGTLTPLALIEPLSPVWLYRDVVPPRAPTGIAVLDEAEKHVEDGSTRTNFNNINYIDVSSRYLHDAKRTLGARPSAYVRGLGNAFDSFFRPPSDFFTLVENRRRVGTFERLYNRAVEGVVSGGQGSERYPDVNRQFRQGPGRRAWLALAAYAVALVGGAVALWWTRKRHDAGIPFLGLAFLWSTVAYITLLSNVLEVGENNRFRLYSDPLALMLLAALVVAWRRPGRKRAATAEG